ncbi:MAG: carbon monoxide dehydrogenase [Chloroflexi bacterium RBG_13_52_12]|nr:MAG: carbon monoxide dehydrogenase [Chloroflexi bacterium RBG_13_52_12]
MKIAISGKGGVGKTLLTAFLSKTFASSGYSVIAIDADPDANLAATLGFPNLEKITPISELSDLIEERVGVRPGTSGSFFKLNPKVDDLPENYSVKMDGIRLMSMGRIKRGGTGCYCPEGALLQALLSHLLLQRDEVVILDMEAGIEHLSRGTVKAVDKLIIVVEPGRRSLETAETIIKLAQDLGLRNIAVVGNKIRNEADKDFIKSNLPGIEILGFIYYDPAINDADHANLSLFSASPQTAKEVKGIYDKLISASRQADVKAIGGTRKAKK